MINHSQIDNYAALEALPPEVRREVCFAARIYEAADILHQFRPVARTKGRKWAIGWMAASIYAADQDALIEFAANYRRCYRQDLPHHAARATILRYLPPRGVKRLRLGGAAPQIKAAWMASERLLPR